MIVHVHIIYAIALFALGIGSLTEQETRFGGF